MTSTLEAASGPTFVLVRPRAGSFRTNSAEVERLVAEVAAMVALGADGVVVGALDASGRVDRQTVVELVGAAEGVPVTFHRAFDQVEDPFGEVEFLVGAGVKRVLTSGGEATAWEGRDVLRRLVALCAGELTVLGGGGIRGDHVGRLVEETGLTEVHARASAIGGIIAGLRQAMDGSANGAAEDGTPSDPVGTGLKSTSGTMRVVVEPHDPTWPEKFRRESGFVARALGTSVVRIHHIGSTAIPTIRAKPIIDMLAEVTSLPEVDSRTAAMRELGYEALGEFGIPGRRYFRKDGESGFREYQVHAFLAGSGEITRHLAFRDYLIAHPMPAQEYSDLKSRLALEHPQDIEGYMDGKDAFIEDVQRRAVEWWAARPTDRRPEGGSAK